MYVACEAENKTMVGYKALYEAYLRCRKHKRNTHNALAFEYDLIGNLTDLETSLNDYSYTPSRSVCFLTTSPKLREVFAADFRDRVVHHLVVPILERIFEPKFIYDSYSNRRGCGTHKAVKRAQKFSRATAYYLQLDIKNFFYSIEKMKLFGILKHELVQSRHKVQEMEISLPQMLWLLNTILFHDVTKGAIVKGDKRLLDRLLPHKTLFKRPKSHGLPIGNLTSQFFANVYMNGFDNFVKRRLKVKYYLRYVDDFVLFSHSEEELEGWHREIRDYLHRELGLRLRDDFKLRKNSEGLDFLGYIVRPHYLLTRRRVVNNFKCKKARFLDRYEREKGKMSLEEIKRFLSVRASFLGHIKHSNSYRLQNRVGAIHETNPFDDDRA